MRMRMLLAAVALAGCPASYVSQVEPPGPPVPAVLLQSAASGPITGGSTTLQLAPLAGGDLVVVAVSNILGPFSEAHVTDDGSDFAQPLWWSFVGCESSVPTIDVWTISNATAGATGITVELKAPSTFEVFALEVGGITGEGIPVDTSASTGGSQTKPEAPALDAAAGQLLVSTIATCGSIDSLVADNPFTTVNALTGTAFAYLIPATDGAYGAAWNYSGATWSAHTDSFVMR